MVGVVAKDGAVDRERKSSVDAPATARVSTTLHHVYESTTRDGRAVRFEEKNGPATVLEGDITTVWYVPDRPERATAHAPDQRQADGRPGCAP
ncbi:hypothetical protein [Streptomyces griseosporeus]|uniref:hypothetical protein n=1 Tax=Streptomyces griseosporeus TaxID=1910 RepID=UPI0036FE77BE